MKKISPKVLKYTRLTHRYLSYICTGILLVYIVSGFLLNHYKEFEFMRQKREKIVDYVYEVPQNKLDFTAEQAQKIMRDLGYDAAEYKRFTLKDGTLSIVGANQLVIKIQTGSKQAYIKEIHRPKFLTALNQLHRNPNTTWTIFSDAFLLLTVIVIITGLLIVPGKKGVFGWGGVLVLAGVLIPLLIYWLAV